MTFDLWMWALMSLTHEGSYSTSMTKVWLHLDFMFSEEANFMFFSLSYNLTWDDLWPWNVTFDIMNIYRFPYCSYDPSLIAIGLQLFEWHQNFHVTSTFNISYNLTWDDLWPWNVTFDLINIWRFPYCIYDPSLVAIGLQVFDWH